MWLSPSFRFRLIQIFDEGILENLCLIFLTKESFSNQRFFREELPFQVELLT